MDLDLFFEQNPWQKAKTFALKSFIKRRLLEKIAPWIKREEIITITGPRQAGKTTLIFKIIQNLLSQDKEKAENIFYFNFDQEIFTQDFSQPQALLNFVKSRAKGPKSYLFLDEIQRLKEPGLYLKILYDLPYKPFKIIVSGSSSLLLRAKIKEYLTGRQVSFNLLPLSLQEAALHLGFNLPIASSNILFDLVEQFAVFGGYPGPFKEQNPKIKKKLLFNLYWDYVQKDIRDFARVENTSSFNKLTSLVSFQIGNLVNKNELATNIQADTRTVDKYLEILEQTFVLKLVKPYFTNRRKEIVKTPKAYYLDNGLRNAQLNNFASYQKRPDKGAVFENLVLTEILKYLPPDYQLRYWRTQAGAEVDFIFVKAEELTPVEVKSNLKEIKISKSLASFITSYQPKKAFLVSETAPPQEKTYNNCQIKLIPFTKLPEIFV